MPRFFGAVIFLALLACKTSSDQASVAASERTQDQKSPLVAQIAAEKVKLDAYREKSKELISGLFYFERKPIRKYFGSGAQAEIHSGVNLLYSRIDSEVERGVAADIILRSLPQFELGLVAYPFRFLNASVDWDNPQPLIKFAAANRQLVELAKAEETRRLHAVVLGKTLSTHSKLRINLTSMTAADKNDANWPEMKAKSIEILELLTGFSYDQRLAMAGLKGPLLEHSSALAGRMQAIDSQLLEALRATPRGDTAVIARRYTPELYDWTFLGEYLADSGAPRSD